MDAFIINDQLSTRSLDEIDRWLRDNADTLSAEEIEAFKERARAYHAAIRQRNMEVRKLCGLQYEWK